MDDNTLKELNSLKSSKKLNKTRTRSVLEMLLSVDGIGLPMASTYLRFLNPAVYQIIDARAFRAAFSYEGICVKDNGKDFVSLTTGRSKDKIEIYIKYLEQLETLAKNGYHGLFVEFENLDRFLYNIDKAAGFKVLDKVCTKKAIGKWNEVIKSIKKQLSDN